MSHVSAGGRLPGPGWLSVMFVLLAAMGVGLARRPRGFDVQVLVLGAAQLVLHVVFHAAGMAAAGPAAMPSGSLHHVAGPMHDHAGSMHHHVGLAHHHGGMVVDPVSGGGHHPTAAAMTLGHGAAVLITAVCLAYGDRLVRRLAAMVRPRLGFLQLSPLPPAAPQLLPGGPRVLVPRYGVLLARALPRRGPPPPRPA
ncbi:hypothetical protein FCH28_12665 [Streptomyces piniterrae]|uniref:DUF5134 domain-containing protein n=1 Tax=Streptomyces piniterrae TaxID=2571125 RepID=A0A4U0NK43_9ACTN|nr:hypothetical protein FCH28_12665 [Streptomyces piniterrae]